MIFLKYFCFLVLDEAANEDLFGTAAPGDKIDVTKFDEEIDASLDLKKKKKKKKPSPELDEEVLADDLDDLDLGGLKKKKKDKKIDRFDFEVKKSLN